MCKYCVYYFSLSFHTEQGRVSSVQFSCSVMSDSLRPHELQHTRPSYPSSSPGVHPNSVHQVGDAIQPSHPLSSPSLPPPVSPSMRVFSNESTLHMMWPKYWSFSFSIVPSKEHPGLISYRMDWLDLLAFQGTLKSLVISFLISIFVLPGLMPIP